MTTRDKAVGISGIGYEGLTQGELVATLCLRGVEVLVDVRLNAVSRKRGLSKVSLASALEQSGITYLHMPTLGNERDNRAGYAEITSASAQQARDRYRAVLQEAGASESLQDLATLAMTRNVAVLCFEKDERHCHREQVLEQVRALLEGELVSG